MAKITVVGAGMVGSAAAYTLVIKHIARELVIIDVDKHKAKGEALDIQQTVAFSQNVSVVGSDDYKETKDSDIVFITAGAAQKPGETRLDLASKNIAIMTGICKELKRHCKNAIFVIVANPVDVLTYIARDILGPKVFGTGTALDTIRLRYHASLAFNLNTHNVHALILGEHGDHSFPVWSHATAAGVPFARVKGVTKPKLEKMHKQVVSAAYTIIKQKGYTNYAIATVIGKIADCIVHDTKEVIPVSVIPYAYGIRNACVSVPCIIGKAGVEEIIVLDMLASEKKKLKEAAKVISEYIKRA
jgi:L-lactate dehydrogenase